MRVWGVQEGIDGYPYWNHLVELWPGNQEEHLGTINESVYEINKIELKAEKIQVVQIILKK